MALAHYQGYVENVSTGKALEGAVIRVYSYPGNVLQSTFADASSTPKPVVSSDSNGGFDFYIADGAYDLEYVYNGDVLERLVNVPIFNPANYAPSGNVDTILGVPAADGDLGAFTGTTIPNDSTVKGALQSLETATELRPTSTTLAASGGAALVGSNDGAGGSLWTTLAGFVTYLRSSVGSAIVGFVQAGTGAVARTAQAKMRERLSVVDFGAVGDGTTNDAAAIQAAITAAIAAKKDVYFPYGIYKVNSTILKAQDFYCPNLYAEAGTVLDGTAISNAPTLKIKGGSGQLAAAVIDGFRFRAGNGVNSTGLEIADQCGVEYQHCVFETGTWGVTYHNEAVSGFSEYCVGRNCTFLSALTSGAVRYRVSSGNDSFHGTGLANHCQIQFNGATNAIKIESGALVYNAPLDFHAWVTGSSKVIVNNASSLRQSTYGTITVEVFGSEPYATAPEVFGGTGSSVNHSGDVISLGTSWLGPKVRLMGSRTVFIGSEGGAANGSVAFKQSPYSLLKTLSNAAGGTTILSLSEINSADMFVHIEGPNYDYRYRITAGVGLFGAGLVTNLSNPVAFNASGAGAPTFTVDSSGNFIITNTNYTSSYTAFVTIVPFGPARGAVLSSGADYKPS